MERAGLAAETVIVLWGENGVHSVVTAFRRSTPITSKTRAFW
ncbi:MAG: hypothetical protein N2652_03265 [Kiritimatiellae bacterium]|nr:hypothetical protein [Kiritimatiellia bacterium]